MALLVGLAAISLAATGCGGGGSEGSSSTTSGSGATPQKVTIKGYAYDPDPITVPVGSTITWTNDDPTEHTATASNGTFDTGTIKSDGGTATVVLEKPGTYDYTCQFHQFMKGQVTVQG